MYLMETSLPYILTGCIFYAFGLKWCYEYAKYSLVPSPRDQAGTNNLKFTEKCERFLASHPIEGSLKLVATAIGLVGTLVGGLPDVGAVSPRVSHATIYLFFAFSGLVDVLHFYFPHNVSDGLVKLALAQSFFVEGFLFIWANVEDGVIVNTILAAIVWVTSLAVALELIWPEVELLRGCSTLLHGGWIAHMVRMYRIEPLLPARVALAFTWHVAAASAVTLCTVACTRSCTPKPIFDEPPVPIYDHYHYQEPNQQV